MHVEAEKKKEQHGYLIWFFKDALAVLNNPLFQFLSVKREEKEPFRQTAGKQIVPYRDFLWHIEGNKTGEKKLKEKKNLSKMTSWTAGEMQMEFVQL